MKYSLVTICAALTFAAIPLQAQTSSTQPAVPSTIPPPPETATTTSVPAKRPPVPVFKFQQVKPREYATGYTLGIFGGGNVYQFDDSELEAPASTFGLDLNSQVAAVGGVK